MRNISGPPPPIRMSDLRSLPDAHDYLEREAGRLSEEAQHALRATGDDCVVGIVGAGTMGRTIAMAVRLAGLRAILIEHDEAQRRSADEAIKRWSAQAGLSDEVGCTDSLAELAAADIVIEAVFEDLTTKAEVLEVIDRHAGARALIATNSSSLDIDRLGAASRRPENFLGTHFFLPAHRTPVLEIVAGKATSADATRRAMAFAARLGKLAVPAGNCDGYIGNRLFDRFYQEAMFLVEEGATVAAVDDALELWGMALGPFRTLDRVGNDLINGVCRRRASERPGIVLPDIIGVIHDAGRHGAACGRGWYDYAPNSRRGEPSSDVDVLIEDFARKCGRKRRDIDAEEIIARCVLAVALEGQILIADRIARSEGDIDVMFTRGYGFPASTGGPMFLARAMGASARAALLTFHGCHASRGLICDAAVPTGESGDTGERHTHVSRTI